MSIIRTKRSSNYAVIPNHIHECGLSWRAVGMLTYLLSKPDDWKVSVAQLIKHTKQSDAPLGRDGVYAVLRELCDKGYVARQDARNESGTFVGTNYLVSDEPFTSNPLTGEPLAANPTLINTDLVINTDQKQTSTSQAKCDRYDWGHVKEEYNALAERHGLSKIRLVSDGLKKLVKDSFALANKMRKQEQKSQFEFNEFISGYLMMVDQCMTPFHQGQNERNWKADFKYIFAKSVCESLLVEGVMKR